MPYQRLINVKCNRFIGSEFKFVLNFVDDINKQTVLAPLNVCDNSDNSDVCINCANRIWHFFMNSPNHLVLGSFDPLAP